MAKVLPIDGESLRVAPKAHCTHTQMTLGEEATFYFCNRVSVSTEPDAEGRNVAMIESVCTMSLGHFLDFASMVERQAQILKEQEPELVAIMERIRGANSGGQKANTEE